MVLEFNINSMRIKIKNNVEILNNEANLLNPVIEILNKLGFTVISEPVTIEKGRYLAPDLVAFKRISSESLIALLIEAKIKPQIGLPEQLTKYLQLLPGFTHALLIPSHIKSDVERLIRGLDKICLLLLDVDRNMMEVLNCDMKLINISFTSHDPILMRFVKQYVSLLRYGPGSQVFKLNQVLRSSAPGERAEKLKLLMPLITKLPKRELIVDAAKQVIALLKGSAAFTEILRKPFVSIMFHYVYNVSTAYVRDYNGLKHPILYYRCS